MKFNAGDIVGKPRLSLDQYGSYIKSYDHYLILDVLDLCYLTLHLETGIVANNFNLSLSSTEKVA